MSQTFGLIGIKHAKFPSTFTLSHGEDPVGFAPKQIEFLEWL